MTWWRSESLTGMGHVPRQSTASFSLCFETLSRYDANLVLLPTKAIPKTNHWNKFYENDGEDNNTGGNNSYHSISGREGGRIIMLGDGTEVLTDSDDAEMFEYGGDDDQDVEELITESDIPALKAKENLQKQNSEEEDSEASLNKESDAEKATKESIDRMTESTKDSSSSDKAKSSTDAPSANTSKA